MKIIVAIILSWFITIGSGSAQSKNLQVYITISEECPVCMYMTRHLKEMENKYADSADFTLVFPNALSHYKSINKFKDKYGLQHFKSMLDEDQLFVKKHSLKVTPEVIVFDQSSNIIYKGRINDGYFAPGKKKRSEVSNDLDNVLHLWLNEKRKLESWGEAIGCFITFKK